jgi:hypothetical protein
MAAISASFIAGADAVPLELESVGGVFELELVSDVVRFEHDAAAIARAPRISASATQRTGRRESFMRVFLRPKRGT